MQIKIDKITQVEKVVEKEMKKMDTISMINFQNLVYIKKQINLL